MPEDYYHILGVTRDASQTEIEKAYRDLARQHHPDLNPADNTAKEKFKRVQAAFDVLGDPEQRKKYDRYGSAFDFSGGGSQGGYHGQIPPGFENFDFSQLFGDHAGGGHGGYADIFSQFGGATGTRGRKRVRRGGDIHYELNLPFTTAVLGGEAQLRIRRSTGNLETLSVKIPLGIEDGKKIRLRGQGEQPPQGRGPAGDILITIHVSPHACYTRRGNNLEIEVPITVTEAALGAKVEIPTPKGKITLTVPPGTSGGTKLRVKGHGVVATGGQPGDLLAEIRITVPSQIDAQTTDLFRQIGQRNPENPRGELRW